MNNIDLETVEKFFNNTCTPEEAEQVLKWLNTSEGQQYLEESMNSDFDLMDIEQIEQDEFSHAHLDLDSENLLSSIHQRIGKNKSDPQRKRDYIKPLFRVAASVLVIFTASIFYHFAYEAPDEETAEIVPIHYMTSDDQQREITLGDGSSIHLNSNSEVWISQDYMRDRREVELLGEAYFDVVHNPEAPFLVHANEATVEVLGTAFNVKSHDNADNIQVAVTEGRVSLSSKKQQSDDQSVLLNKGQFGYLDLNSHTITVEDFAVENYLAWMSGRLVFEELSLDRVCAQLSRLYEVNCSFEDESIKDLKLTADFSDDSVERTLAVISLSLDISYQLDNGEVIWSDNGKNTWNGSNEEVKMEMAE